MVSKVDYAADTITVGKKQYMLDENSQIYLDGEKASLSAIKPGMRVMVTAKILVRGRRQADSLYGASRLVARSR